MPAFDDPAFGALFDRFADRRVVLLERPPTVLPSSTGRGLRLPATSIEVHGFSSVAVEADWPDAAATRPAMSATA